MQVSSLKGRYKGEAVQSRSIISDNVDEQPKWLLYLMASEHFREADAEHRYFTYHTKNFTSVIQVKSTDWIVRLDDGTVFILSDQAFHLLYIIR